MNNTPRLFAEQNVSIYKIQKDLKLDKSRLYRYASGQIDVENMPSSLLNKLARYFKISASELFDKMVDYRKEG